MGVARNKRAGLKREPRFHVGAAHPLAVFRVERAPIRQLQILQSASSLRPRHHARQQP
jgi:hypothetical protein